MSAYPNQEVNFVLLLIRVQLQRFSSRWSI